MVINSFRTNVIIINYDFILSWCVNCLAKLNQQTCSNWIPNVQLQELYYLFFFWKSMCEYVLLHSRVSLLSGVLYYLCITLIYSTFIFGGINHLFISFLLKVLFFDENSIILRTLQYHLHESTCLDSWLCVQRSSAAELHILRQAQ